MTGPRGSSDEEDVIRITVGFGASGEAGEAELPVHTPSLTSHADVWGPLDPSKGKTDPDFDAAVTRRKSDQRYQRVKDLGAQGGCKIYQVHDQDLKRIVILRMVPTQNAQFPRFLEETQIMGQLGHPHIAEVHDIGHVEGKTFYWTTPHIPGRSFRDLLKALRENDIATSEATSLIRLVSILHKVSLAAAYAHTKGVIHRNINPNNIWMGDNGEVLLMGWNTAKVIQKGDVETDRDTTLTKMREIIGDPSYISPEQVMGQELGAGTDVYSLGVILYEILALRLPFEGSPMEVLTAVVNNDPVPASEKATGRQVPPDLDRCCMRALRRSPRDRQESASALAEELRTWLDVESDKLKRREKAAIWIHKAQEMFQQYLRRKADLGHPTAVSVGPDVPQLPLGEDLAQSASPFGVLAAEGHELVATLHRALGAEPDNAEARQLLVATYRDALDSARTRRDLVTINFCARMIKRYDDGQATAELRRCRVDVSSDPPGATVSAAAVSAQGPRRVSEDLREVGITPIQGMEIGPGPHLLKLESPGYRTVHAPVFLLRGEDLKISVALRLEKDLLPDYIHIPSGSFLKTSERGRLVEVRVDDFFISRFPVTVEEYMAFLNDLAVWDMVTAASHAPRECGHGDLLMKTTSEGRFELPHEDSERGPWDGRWPVFGISLEDAEAYCAWKSAKENRLFQVPSREEWEKADRGADGRRYPWGDLFDPSLCHVGPPCEVRRCPVSIDVPMGDVSVYGVCGMAGNVREWTSTRMPSETGEETCPIGGGSWQTGPLECQCGHWTFGSFSAPLSDVGFRLVWTPGAAAKERSKEKVKGFSRFLDGRGRR